jgi:hypothetical protein
VIRGPALVRHYQPFLYRGPGQRVLVTNHFGNSVSLWKAADLTPLGSFPIGLATNAACSDGIALFVALPEGRLVRF